MRIDFNGSIEFLDRLVKALLRDEQQAAIVVSIGELTRQLRRLVEVGQGGLEFFHTQCDEAAIVEQACVSRVKFDRFVQIRQSGVFLATPVKSCRAQGIKTLVPGLLLNHRR